jgi:hypothetical protein
MNTTDAVVARAMTTDSIHHTSAISPRESTRVLPDVKPSEIQRAQGMPGAQCTRSLACKTKKHTSKSPRSHRIRPAFPAQWCYDL